MASVAWFSVFAQAALVAHALLVPHTTCFEHGTVAHERGHAHAAPSRWLDALSPQSAALWARAGDAPGLEDEHCTVLGTRHLPAPQIFAAELTGQRIPAVAQPVERPAAFSALAQYRLAPKASPPEA